MLDDAISSRLWRSNVVLENSQRRSARIGVTDGEELRARNTIGLQIEKVRYDNTHLLRIRDIQRPKLRK